MTTRSLNRFLAFRRAIVRAKRLYLTRMWGMDIDPTVDFSLSVRFDKTYPKGVHVAAETYIAFEVAILAHDMTRGLYLHTRIGRRCFIGARSIILPGITVGDDCIVGCGSVVTKDVPSGSIVAGNPAVVIRTGVRLEKFGALLVAHENRLRFVNEGAFD